MNEYIIKQLRRNGKNQLLITIKDGECDFHKDDYVVIRKVKIPNVQAEE